MTSRFIILAMIAMLAKFECKISRSADCIPVEKVRLRSAFEERPQLIRGNAIDAVSTAVVEDPPEQ